MTLDAIDDQPFRCEIGFRDQIQLALITDLQGPAEALGQQPARITRSLNRKVKQ